MGKGESSDRAGKPVDLRKNRYISHRARCAGGRASGCAGTAKSLISHDPPGSMLFERACTTCFRRSPSKQSRKKFVTTRS